MYNLSTHIIINNKNNNNNNNHCEKIDEYLELAWELKKAVEYKDDGDTSWCTWNSSQIQTGGIGDRRKDQNHTDYSIIKIG